MTTWNDSQCNLALTHWWQVPTCSSGTKTHNFGALFVHQPSQCHCFSHTITLLLYAVIAATFLFSWYIFTWDDGTKSPQKLQHRQTTERKQTAVCPQVVCITGLFTDISGWCILNNKKSDELIKIGIVLHSKMENICGWLVTTVFFHFFSGTHLFYTLNKLTSEVFDGLLLNFGQLGLGLYLLFMLSKANCDLTAALNTRVMDWCQPFYLCLNTES